MSWLIALILIYISYVDFKSHRIPNTALVFMMPVAFIYFILGNFQWWDQLFATILLFMFLLILWYFFDLGMGDVKLLTLLSLFIISSDVRSRLYFFTGISVASLIYILGLQLASRVRYRRIPLAPSISTATILMLWVK
ncbi:MAG: prepilin peptidase [Candidatus Planktophila sp.]